MRVGKADDRSPNRVDSKLAADFARMGLKVEIEQQEDEAFEIMASNRDTFRAWLAVETQWRVAASMAGLIWIGLDYAAVDVVLTRFDFANDVFSYLQVMELEALTVLNGSV